MILGQYLSGFQRSCSLVPHLGSMEANTNFIFRLLWKYKGCVEVPRQIHCKLVTMAEFHFRNWNTLLMAYSQGECPTEAFAIFRYIHEKGVIDDSFTHAFVLKACSDSEDFDKGIQVHGHTIKRGFESHVYVQTALITMYGSCGHSRYAVQVFDIMPQRNLVSWNALITSLTKCGEVKVARMLFDKMTERNVVSWTGMIDGYTRRNQFLEALILFHEMWLQNIKPNEITMLTVFPAISGSGSLEFGRQIHASSKRFGFTMDVRVTNALLDMYAKCGSINNVFRLFEEISKKNLVSYTSMISAFAMHGLANKAMKQFDCMREKGVTPNEVTFLSILNACSHGGLLEEGRRCFLSMVHEYGLSPGVKHYGCMIDLLGRAGLLEEAEKLIIDMPLEANVILWRTLLSACYVHGNVELGQRVLFHILELEKEYGGDYILLSNIYSSAGKWDDAQSIRRLLNERIASKMPGCSSVDEKTSCN